MSTKDPIKKREKQKRANARRKERRLTDPIFAATENAKAKIKRDKNKDESNAKRREQYQTPEGKAYVQKQNKMSRDKNKDKISQGLRLAPHRFSFSKSNAKIRGLAFTLTKEEYTNLINSHCDYCDNELGSPTNSTGYGLDRLDNDRGYEIDNVVPCCVVCNLMRHQHLTPEETKVAVRAVIEFRKSKIK